MILNELLKGIEYDTKYSTDVEITSIATDSREVKAGSLFIVLNGAHSSGMNYINQAMLHGAKAVVSEEFVPGIPCFVVEDTRKAYSVISSNYYGNPSKNLKIIAIVGTNGKSTTAHFVYDILRFNDYKVGLIGTGNVLFGEEHFEQDMTTPDPINLHHYLAMMRDAGIEYVVMEVSAHAIYFNKMFGIKCEIGLFTNFSEDHLEFFNNMDIYKRVKVSYFNSRYIKVGIVNSDDECGREIMNKMDIPCFSYGLDNPSDVFAIDLEYCVDRTRFVVNMLDEISEFATEIIGKYNVYNILGASIIARLIGIPLYGIRDAVAKLKPVEGRYNVMKTSGADFIVDYAHTPVAMKNVIREAKARYSGKVYVVFGCGGDRDRKKRPIMGHIASMLADEVVLTSDNSRTERLDGIIGDIMEGIETDNYVILEDRMEAIKYAYEMTSKGDVVLVLGKGAEKYQDNGDGKIYYSDSEAILSIAK